MEWRTTQRWSDGKSLAVAVLALAGTLVSGSSAAWATADTKPALPAHVVLVKSSAAAAPPAWPSVNGAMSTRFLAPAADDCTGLVAPSDAGWLTAAPHGFPMATRFVARGQALGGTELAQLETAKPQPIGPSGAAIPSAVILVSVPLPPKRLAEKPVVILAALAPLPPRRPAEPVAAPPQAMALLAEPAPPASAIDEATSESADREEATAPAQDAARPIDDAPEPVAGRLTAERGPPHIESLIERHAQRFDVPARLVRRVVWRESKFNPRLRHGPYWGLMQIRVDTARALGFRGAPSELLDAHTNMTYAVAYLANAYRVAGRDEKRAVTLYASGYYYEAKRKGMLGSLIRVAATED